jgi:hypothetical protein
MTSIGGPWRYRFQYPGGVNTTANAPGSYNVHVWVKEHGTWTSTWRAFGSSAFILS